MTTTTHSATAPDGSRGAFLVDATTPHAVQTAFERFRHEWRALVDCPPPTFHPSETGDFSVKARVARVRDVVVIDVRDALAAGTASGVNDTGDQVRMYIVERGGWTLGGSQDRAEHTVPGGQFLLRHVRRPPHFQTVPYTTATAVVLPTDLLKPLVGDRVITGAAESAEVRLFTAHLTMLHTTLPDLGPAGIDAAHRTVIELAKSVVLGRFDDTEPKLAPALVQAAKDLADRRLADGELSATLLARELNVSVRTLQRAFATTEESAAGYIRQRRLEEARLALESPAPRLTISELAAHWQFADSSHFSRAFKKRYGATPTEYGRMTQTSR